MNKIRSNKEQLPDNWGVKGICIYIQRTRINVYNCFHWGLAIECAKTKKDKNLNSCIVINRENDGLDIGYVKNLWTANEVTQKYLGGSNTEGDKETSTVDGIIELGKKLSYMPRR